MDKLHKESEWLLRIAAAAFMNRSQFYHIINSYVPIPMLWRFLEEYIAEHRYETKIYGHRTKNYINIRQTRNVEASPFNHSLANYSGHLILTRLMSKQPHKS